MNALFIFKLVLILLLLFIIFNLGRALFIMVKGDIQVPMSRYLGRRVIFSVLVILLLLVALGTGLISTHPTPY
ncbi:DUF2909 family protein [Shewanella glacialipiscicola]|uniref:DUF2909 domain-containing protein n=1 Tax=Shewanella glacialipiscicola TaxID=614069 RepID=A0ABQ6J977_9GAMM|nr:DUF2909 family protein [Shewanella glacialipiscicola]MCL1085451.1 DUF2909 domain-containing protein [Shewanella glacialipiscicola]MCU7994280.1 DUF2909 domain-containing protein [Shewanella glacialipiscicola]MCU8025751.1 DUF2909 domain-containing protein [Shewanella glacialipiscicola]GIU03958.1 hypothetical protein TUM4636_01560 [Shewanella glacialipiscicola]GMA83795.1 hypothetical protein GCM10025855_33280 [Shewanella glacialipiscicola]